MRAFGLAAIAVMLAHNAHAQDFLRGSVIEESPVAQRWAGVYGGGHMSYIMGDTNFTGVTRPLIADIVRLTRIEDEMQVSSWPIITNSDGSRTTGFGGFIGYNTQWDELILGADLTYTRLNYKNTASGSMERVATLSNDFQYDVTATATSTVEVKDLLTSRARIGYIFGQFLPYVTGGFALARASTLSVGSVSYPAPVYAGATVPNPPSPGASSGTSTDGMTNKLAYGYALGAGIDIALMPNVFARAEYEYVYLTNISTALSNARVGLAVKF